MKYILLSYTKQAAWAETDLDGPEFQAMTRFYADLGAELTASGELLATEGLADPALTRTVRPAPGGPVVLDSAYADAPEVLVSFSVVDVVDEARALAIAASIVDAVGDAVEVRPLGIDSTAAAPGGTAAAAPGGTAAAPPAG
jgi:hypothetical protein